MEQSEARRWGLRAGLVAAAVAAHVGGVGSPFVFDDVLAVVENPHVRSLWPLWYAAWAEYESPLAGRPLPALSLALNHAAGGLDPLGYKLANLALHAACGLAIFAAVGAALRMPRLARRWARRADAVAFATALLWLVHPLTSECVHYVTQRTESSMALAYVGALACTARAWSSPRPGRWRAAAVAACAVGMACKEVMMSAPLAIVAFEWAYGDRPLRALLRERRAFYAALAACWVPLVVLMATSWRGDTVGVHDGIGPDTYLANQAWVIPRYLRLALWPAGLAVDWGVPRPLELADAWPAVLAIGCAFIAAVVVFVRRPAVGWPLLFVFAVLAPTSSFVPIVTEVGAERRLYLPLAALIALAVVVAAQIADRARVSRRVRVAGLAIVALALGAGSALRAQDYGDRLTLWQGALGVFPDNPRAHVQVGQALVARGQVVDATASLRRAIELDPDLAEGHNELGIVLELQGLRTAARRHYERAASSPHLVRARINLGVLLVGEGEIARARELLRDGVARAPESANGVRALAWLLATDPDPERRRPRRAVALAERAIALGGESALGLDVLAAALAARGDFERAVDVGERAARLAVREGRTPLRADVERRLAAYRDGRVWDQPIRRLR